MKHFLTLCCILLSVNLFAQNQKGFSVSSTSQNPASGKTYALIVGISQYQNPNIPQLQFADRDAIAFRDYLVASEVDSNNITLLLNEQARYSDILLDLDNLCTDIVKPGDKFYFYFSGHGDVESRVITNDGYLLPYDAPSKVYAISAIKVQTLQSYISTLSAKGVQVILITDACHSGNLAGGIDGLKNIQNVLKESWKDDTKILSCQPGEISLEGKEWGNGRGLFSYEFINGIAGLADKNKDGIVNLRELNLYLMDKVADEASPMPQNPMVMGNMETNISTVNQNYLAFLNTSQTNQSFAAIDLKGNKEWFLKGMSDSIKKFYALFQTALDSARYLENANVGNLSAYEYLKKIPANDSTKLLQGLMRRNFAAKIIQEVENDINACLNRHSTSFTRKGYTMIVPDFNYPGLLEELIGKEKIKALGLSSKLFFENALRYGANLAVIKLRDGRYGFATDYGSRQGLLFLDSAIAEDPNAVYALELRASIKHSKGEFQKAIDDGKRAHELSPYFQLPIRTIISSYEQLKQYDSAVYYLKTFVMIDTTYSEDVFSELGLCYFLLENNDSSSYYFSKAYSHNENVKTDSEKLAAKYERIASYYFECKDYDKSIHFRQLQLKFNESAIIDNYGTLAFCYANLCQTDSALKYIELGLKYKKYIFIGQLSEIDCIKNNSKFQKLIKEYPASSIKSKDDPKFQKRMDEMEKDYPNLFFQEDDNLRDK